MKKTFLLLFIFILLLPFTVLADESIIKIVSIPDGDTLNIINGNNKKVKIRLYGTRNYTKIRAGFKRLS